MELVTSFKTLMQLASELGKAKLSKDDERIEKAQKEHDDYKKLCLESDKIMLHCDTRYRR